jgi:tetratricopeptide (TPR) repeat protein
LERYERTRAIDERCGNEWRAAIASGNIGEILVDQGRMAEAEPLLAEALRVWRATQAPSSVGFGASLLGCVRARTGRRQQAMELFDEAIAAYTSTGEVFDLVQTRLRIAEAHLLTGDTDAAISHLDDAETGLTTALRAAGIPSGAGDPAALSGPEAAMRPAMLRLRAVADEQSGKHAQAVANLRQSLHIAREHDAAHSIAVALHLLSWADDASAAERREAASVLAQLGIVWLPDLPRSSAAPSTVDVSDARVQVPRPRVGDQVRA